MGAAGPRRVVVLVGGSIAAWKACDVVSGLVQAGRHVEVVMTRAARRFVGPVSFAALTHRPVFTDETWFEGTGGGAGPAEHLRATEGADLLLVAPCTANLLGKFAHGLADDIVSSTWLGAACAKVIAPAMNARMWASPRVQANASVLRGDGVLFVGPEEGWLAEHETGPGRMAEPETILARLGDALP